MNAHRRPRTSPRISPKALARKLRRLLASGIRPSESTVEDVLECLDALAWYDDHCGENGSYDGELFGHLTEATAE
jgi:hypothetical protein